ncbi:chorismate transformation enzyme, FkbO/Hyg5 family [Coprobacter fastidiosus]
MNDCRYICRSLRESQADFSAMVRSLLNRYQPKNVPVRLVFFGDVTDNVRYREELDIIRKEADIHFGDKLPVISYVAQKPLDGSGLVMEAHELKILQGETVEYKSLWTNFYITVTSSHMKHLFLGGVMSDNLDESFSVQSYNVFDIVEKILQIENMPVHSIVRQWNYIEQITAFDGEHQHYQDFNDARSFFYNYSQWPEGYPAATGIGTACGGIVVDINAVYADDASIKIDAIDNGWQVAAHAYSQGVLFGEKDPRFQSRTTPKFERAKRVKQEKYEIVYVSGTAAIRGEESLLEVGIEKQTQATIENIDYLISEENIRRQGILFFGSSYRLKSCRVYLKDISLMENARVIVEKLYSDVESIYLLADVCRDELLIEIEGIASV